MNRWVPAARRMAYRPPVHRPRQQWQRLRARVAAADTLRTRSPEAAAGNQHCRPPWTMPRCRQTLPRCMPFPAAAGPTSRLTAVQPRPPQSSWRPQMAAMATHKAMAAGPAAAVARWPAPCHCCPAARSPRPNSGAASGQRRGRLPVRHAQRPSALSAVPARSPGWDTADRRPGRCPPPHRSAGQRPPWTKRTWMRRRLAAASEPCRPAAQAAGSRTTSRYCRSIRRVWPHRGWRNRRPWLPLRPQAPTGAIRAHRCRRSPPANPACESIAAPYPRTRGTDVRSGRKSYGIDAAAINQRAPHRGRQGRR